MPAPDLNTCEPWATIADVERCEECDAISATSGGPIPDADVLEAIQIASNVLHGCTAQQFPGQCQITVRPCRGPWCECYDYCICCGVDEIALGNYPIVSIDQVVVDGAVLPATAYRVDNYRTLVGIVDTADPNFPNVAATQWPCCQDLEMPSSGPNAQPNTWEVTYTYGQRPPPGLVRAAAILACELLKACFPSAFGDDCELPENVTSVAQNGLTYTIEPLLDELENGFLGIPAIDLALKRWNPNQLRRRPAVFNPDRVGRIRRAGT